MTLPAIENYDDAKLNELLVAVLVETERRKAVETIPAQIDDLRHKFIEGGGDPALLD